MPEHGTQGVTVPEETTAPRPQRSRELAALHEAALAITAELSLDKVLQKIVDAAQELANARYVALGVLGEDDRLAYFVTAGLTPAEIAAIGDRPHGSGLLGVLLRSQRPLRLPNIGAHPESCGFPPHHPPMTSFLGAPLIHRGRTVGSLYLSEKVGSEQFTAEDEALIEMLAAQAAVAVENARLFGLSDEALHRKVEELQAERRNLRAIADQMPEGVAIVDASAENVVLANRAARTLLGAGAPQAGDANGGRIALRPVGAGGEPVPPAETAMHRAVVNGETVAVEQMCLTRADGSEFTALANVAPLYDREGHIIGGIVVFQDITALKEIDRLKDELISIISHELRNPLTAIRGRAQLMLRVARRTSGREDDVVGLEAIDAQVEKLAEMVRELLDVSQLRLGLMELRRQPTDLVVLARQSVEQFRMTDEHHAFHFEAVVDNLIGHWDGMRLEQVIFNLLENAQKYSPHGGAIKVQINEQSGAALVEQHAASSDEAGSSSLSLALAASAQRWAVAVVSDEGIGIPKAAQRHLFDRFYRAANAKGQAETGLGLGLYICHEIVAQHGGSIWLESTEGRGTTFYIALPL